MAIETTDGRMMTIQCRHCAEIFVIPARRGRPPHYCNLCIDGGDAVSSDEVTRQRLIAAANARVDNLEMLLRSRGLHIKQNQEPWR